ncbi:MAG: hypothetical protein ABFD76_15460 [Smithella sp.]
MNEFWMVWRLGGQGPTHQHEYLSDAKKEAERLAASNPGIKFVVLRSVGYCEIVNPAIWHDVIEQIPF